MKNHFGEFDESALKALRDAYNPDANSFAESFDFTQCQRSDGTVYGTSGSCAQKGSKEVKSSQGGVGMFGATGKDNAKKAQSGNLKIDALGSQATIDLISEAAKADGSSPKDKAKVIQMGYKHLTDLAKGEGKKPPTLTSIVSGDRLKKLGIDPDKANVKSGSRGKDDKKNAAAKELADIKKARAKRNAEIAKKEQAAAKAKSERLAAKAAAENRVATKADVDAARKVLMDFDKANSRNYRLNKGVPNDILAKHQRHQDEYGAMQKSLKEGIPIGQAKSGESDARWASNQRRAKEGADADRKRRNNARGRSNRNLLNAASKSGCTYEQIKSGNCMM